MIIGLRLLEHNPGLNKVLEKILNQILEQMLEHSLVCLLREAAAARPLPITPWRQSGCGAPP